MPQDNAGLNNPYVEGFYVVMEDQNSLKTYIYE